MALNNCTITSTSVTVTSNQAVGSTANQVLVITPDAGYVVAAENFSKQSPPTGIDTITLSNSGTAYADDNTVLVTCDLTNAYNPGTSSVTLTIDIDGDATDKKARPYTYAGTWDQVVNSNASAGPITNLSGNSYSGSNTVNNSNLIFNQTYTAASGYYFSSPPTFTPTSVTTGGVSYAANYVDTITPTAINVDGLITAYNIKVSFITPEVNVSGHNIDVNEGVTAAISTSTNLITGVIIDDSSLSPAGETRDLKVYGTPGSSFRLFIRKEGATDADDSWYGFPTDPTTGVTSFSSSSSSYSSNYTIPSTGIGAGVYILRIFFDDVNLQNPQSYFISVIGGTSPATNTTQGSSDNNDAFEITLTGANDITVTTTATGTSLAAAYVNNVITANAADDPYDAFGNIVNAQDLKITVTHSSGKALYKRREPIFSEEIAYAANNSTTPDYSAMNDFTNTVPADNTATAFEIMGLNITSTDGATSLVIESNTDGYGISNAGPASVASVLNLDNFINQQPTANALSINTDYETAQAITLAGSDPESDTLTFATTVNPSNGSLSGLNSSTGAITYTPNSAFSGSDSFKYTVNDGIEDSTAATVSVTVASSGSSPGGAPSGGRWTIDTHLADGSVSGQHFVSSDNYCSGGSLSVMPGGAASCLSVGSWVRYSTVAGGCGTSFGRAKVTSHSTTDGIPTAYISNLKKYPTREDSHNDTNGINC